MRINLPDEIKQKFFGSSPTPEDVKDKTEEE